MSYLFASQSLSLWRLIAKVTAHVNSVQKALFVTIIEKFDATLRLHVFDLDIQIYIYIRVDM